METENTNDHGLRDFPLFVYFSAVLALVVLFPFGFQRRAWVLVGWCDGSGGGGGAGERG